MSSSLNLARRITHCPSRLGQHGQRHTNTRDDPPSCNTGEQGMVHLDGPETFPCAHFCEPMLFPRSFMSLVYHNFAVCGWLQDDKTGQTCFATFRVGYPSGACSGGHGVTALPFGGGHARRVTLPFRRQSDRTYSAKSLICSGVSLEVSPCLSFGLQIVRTSSIVRARPS